MTGTVALSTIRVYNLTMSESPEETARKHGQGLHSDVPNVNCLICAKLILQNHIDAQLPGDISTEWSKRRKLSVASVDATKRPDTKEGVVWGHGEPIPFSKWNRLHPESQMHDNYSDAVQTAWGEHLGAARGGNTPEDNEYEALVTGFNSGEKFGRENAFISADDAYERGRRDEREVRDSRAEVNVQQTAAQIILQKRLDERDAEIVRLRADEVARHNDLAIALGDGLAGKALRKAVEAVYERALEDDRIREGGSAPEVLDRVIDGLRRALK
jgi:hypothetical protein